MSNEMEHGKVSHITFADLRIRPGTWMRLRSLFDKAPDCEVEFAAVIHAKSIFVTLPGSMAGKRGMKAGDRYLVSGFNGTSEFSFSSQVLQVQDSPFSLAHLSYPEEVEARVIRESPRFTVAIPLMVKPDGETRPISGTMRDLSSTGALIELDAIPGRVSGSANIMFATLFNGRDVHLNFPATIRHVRDVDGIIKSGFEFGDLTQNDKLILYYLLFAFSSRE